MLNNSVERSCRYFLGYDNRIQKLNWKMIQYIHIPTVLKCIPPWPYIYVLKYKFRFSFLLYLVIFIIFLCFCYLFPRLKLPGFYVVLIISFLLFIKLLLIQSYCVNVIMYFDDSFYVYLKLTWNSWFNASFTVKNCRLNRICLFFFKCCYLEYVS